MKTRAPRLLTGATLILAGLAAGLILSQSVSFEAGRAIAGPTAAIAAPPLAEGEVPESPFVKVADAVVPGVVAISTSATRQPQEGRGRNFHPWGDMFEDLFPNDPRQEGGDRQRQRPRRDSGSGSGFLIDAEGYILTNNHVISKADEVKVLFSNGNEIVAKVVGQDPETDVALLKIDPDDYEGTLSPLYFGDSEKIRVGDWAIAIGNPFGQLAGTLTVGVISAKGRADLNIMGGTPAYQNFIQTDASINFGNSGGPLVNSRGEVIGVNTAINPAGQGIGFAIPINMASRIADELRRSGHVTRGYLGIYPQTLTPELAESLEIEGTEGILIAEVVDDTPAARAGLETGDVITRLNGTGVNEVNSFRLLVAEQEVGGEIRLDVLRDGRKKKIGVTLEARPGAVVASMPAEEEESWAGLQVEELDSRAARRLVEDPTDEGVVVVDVEIDSAAEEAGIRVGDIIKEVGNVEVSDLADYAKAQRKYEEKKAVAILLKRGNQTQYVGLKP